VPAYRVQKIRADANGIFHYAMPRAGWWGFAATLDTDRTVQKDNEEKPVVLMTSFWVLARDFKAD
jgi:cobalt/nickel transport protein